GGFFAFMRRVEVSRVRDAGPLDETPPEGSGPGIADVESTRTWWASLWGVAAGLALGEMALARPDFIFYWAPVPVYLLYWRLSRTWRRPYTWFAVSLAAMLALYLAHLSVYTYPYTLDLYHNTIINLRRLWPPAPAPRPRLLPPPHRVVPLPLRHRPRRGRPPPLGLEPPQRRYRPFLRLRPRHRLRLHRRDLHRRPLHLHHAPLRPHHPAGPRH